MDARDGDGVAAKVVDDARRERVRDSAQRTLTQHADLFQRLRADGVDDGDDATTE